MAAWALTALLLVAGVESDLQAALERSGIDRSGLGVAIGRAGEPPLFTVNPDEPRVPASNEKLITAAAALQVLGADFRFETLVGLDEAGSLVVVGDGDPNFSGRFLDGDADRVLRGIASDLAGQGVTRIEGDLLLDATRFDSVTVHPDWPADQLDRWYCAPVAALVFNDSCWDVTVRPGPRAGAPAVVEVVPALLHPPITNDCTTIQGGAQVVHIGRAPDGGLLTRGRILTSSAGISGNVTVADPVRFFGDALRAALAERGIEVAGTLRVGKGTITRPLARYHSGLDRTLQVMLTRSQNLYAECVFKRLGSGSFEDGARAVREALTDLGVPTDGMVVMDGSGLADTNRVSPRTLYGVLQAMRDRPVFRGALAEGGEGTLRKRYRAIGERLQAKTGSISGVSSLSGYVEGREGGTWVFTLLANGKSKGHARAFQDRVVQALAEAP